MITNGYTTLALFKATVDVEDTADDTELERHIEAASRAIDKYCNRFFYAAAAQTRRYTPYTADRVVVDDLRTVTTLKTDASGDGTFETTWAAADYLLEPLNAAVDGEPYTSVCLPRSGGRVFPVGSASVQIVGDFGWAAVPTQVAEACIVQAHRYYTRKQAPMGVLHLPGVEGVSGMRLTARLDPDVELMIMPLRRSVVLVG